jgi:hypothetical protein
MPINFGPLQQFAPRDHLLKTLFADKMVIVAVALARPLCPARGRDNKMEREADIAHAHQDRILTNPGWAGKYYQQWLRGPAIE